MLGTDDFQVEEWRKRVKINFLSHVDSQGPVTPVSIAYKLPAWTGRQSAAELFICAH